MNFSEKELRIICEAKECKNKGTYSLPGTCLNCGAHYTLVITRGHRKPGFGGPAVCESCGCCEVRA